MRCLSSLLSLGIPWNQIISDSFQFLDRFSGHLADPGNKQREAKMEQNTSHGSFGGQKENYRQNADVMNWY